MYAMMFSSKARGLCFWSWQRLPLVLEVFLIRAITPEDSAAVSALAVASGLFPMAAIGFVDKMMTDYFGGNADEGHVCIIDVEDEPVGVAYYQPTLATDRTWYLTMIGVRRDKQGQGRGASLMEYVEKTLQESGQRVLLVETSGLEAVWDVVVPSVHAVIALRRKP